MAVPSHCTGIIVNHPPGFPVLNDALGKREGKGETSESGEITSCQVVHTKMGCRSLNWGKPRLGNR